MIINELYPSDPNFSATTAEVTVPFNDLALTDGSIDPVHAYYMGAITGDAARLYTGKSITLSGSSLTSDKFTISDGGGSVNWGIMHSPPNSAHENIIYYNGSQWYSTTTSYRLINKLNAFSCRVPGGLSLRFAVKPKQTVTLNGRSVVYCIYRMLIDSVNISMTAKEFTDFIENGSTIAIQTGISIKWEDAIDDRYWEVDYNGTTYLVALISCTIGNWYSYYSPDTNVYPKPFVSIRVGDDLIIQPDCETGYQYNASTEIWVNDDWDDFKLKSFFYNDYTHNISSNYLPGDTNIIFPVVGDIPLDIMDWDSRQGNYIPYVFNDDITCFVNYSTYTTIDGVRYYKYNLYAVLSPIDIYKALFCAFWRDSASGSTTAIALYVAGDLVTIYDAANNPTKKEEFTTYAAIENKLRIWQKYGHDITENDYDPDNPPTPTPPHPDPDPPTDEENGGDDILPPDTLGVGATMGFVTQYCLNASQISELGALLWTSFTDPDYWKNFMFSLALDTGSFNTSALLDYFVSLRVYPFPLLNVPSYSSWGQDMYVGTGVVPLHFTTALHYINTFADWVDAGSCSIPFTFGDFRDYNQEITLYLPFCGTVQLEPADVLGGTISAKYAVDFSSGACTAVVMIETWDGHKYPIAILPGQIGADVPLTATTAGQVAARLGSDVLNVAGILLDGAKGAAGAVAPMVAGAVTENPAMIATGAAQMAGNNVATVAGVAGQALNMATRPGIGAPMLSGGRGFSSFGCPQKCYVQIRRPFYDEPANYESTEGHPAAEQVLVSSCQGLARFVNPNVSSIEAMEEEKEEIRRRLAAGVII